MVFFPLLTSKMVAQLAGSVIDLSQMPCGMNQFSAV
jgi:hypothetical protein